MRTFGLILICSAIGGSVAGQQPAAPVLDPSRNHLDALLIRWEQEMRGVNSIVAQCVRTSLDKTFQMTEVFDGTARYMKPSLAMLEMQKRGKSDVFEKYICTGTFLYEYVPQNKVIRVHELPPPKPGQVADDNFLSFLFGMKAEEARRRYDLRLVKEDQYYVYIEILPRLPSDKVDFQRARLVLNNQTFLPRELWFEQPNGNEVKWDIPKVESGVTINRNDFTSPNVPQGWNMVRVPRGNDVPSRPNNVPPRVIRPNQ
jgi:TIGR03009 family protein